VAAALREALLGGRTAARLVHAWKRLRPILGGQLPGRRRSSPRRRGDQRNRQARCDQPVHGHKQPSKRSGGEA
jgi:hypothetical protein